LRIADCRSTVALQRSAEVENRGPHQKLSAVRQWSVRSIATLDAPSTVAPLPYAAFVLLFAADGRGVTDETLREQASQFLKAGARYVCCWGPDCKRVHDAFDLAATDLGFNREGAVVMTTWHDQESLKDVVWFAANAAFSDEAYPEADDALVAIAVGSFEWEAEIHDYLRAGTPVG